jgi:hypothetical protein
MELAIEQIERSMGNLLGRFSSNIIESQAGQDKIRALSPDTILEQC